MQTRFLNLVLKGQNSEKGPADDKNMSQLFFLMRNMYLKFKNPSIYHSNV